MLKRFLLIALTALVHLTASAQFRYTFKDTTTPYVQLSGATSVNGTTIWDEEDYSIPLPFTFKIDSTISLTSLNLSLPFGALLNTIPGAVNVSGFEFIDADIADRAALNGTTSLSPIRYLTTGTAPNRIFKLELKNAGFFNEFFLHNTMDDSFDVQIWLYETRNVVELHYGPSRITYPSDYYHFTTSGPFVSYLKNLDIYGGTTGAFYFLKGNPASPTLDSAIQPGVSLSTALNAWPANGKVYRFTPRGAACTIPAANYSLATPIGKTVTYTYTGTTAGIDSLVWNFGDGQKQKVTQNYTTPVVHTFATNGKYTVTVTAYSRCGNNTFSKQLALAIGDLSSLGDVRVYPNPAGNYLTCDGLQAGATATILSIVGQELLTTTIRSTKQLIDISDLPSGTYMLILSNTNGTSATVKVVKQ